MAENDQDQPKIIVDDDWKKQAQAEKEALDQKMKEEPAAEAPADETPDDAGAQGDTGQLPEANFTTLVSSLATQAMMAMGGMEDPRSGRRVVDLDLAKYHIDTLAMLEEKTAGNRSEDESKLLDEAVYQIRMHYVNLAQRAAQM